MKGAWGQGGGGGVRWTGENIVLRLFKFSKQRQSGARRWGRGGLLETKAALSS